MHTSAVRNHSEVDNMKKILLVGDSIRMGYDAYVKESMQNLAEVYYPASNSAHTANILRNLHTWTDDLRLYEADAVHFNAGLWDTVRIYGDGPLIGADTYRDNMRRIVKRIRFLFPGAKLIFATSTPVLEDGYIEEFETRSNCDVEEYNGIACEVMTEEGVVINDLYALLRDVPVEYHSDQTHFYTAAATELIGMQVNRILCQTLGLDESRLTPPDPMLFHCPKCALGDKEAYEQRGHIYVRKR